MEMTDAVAAFKTAMEAVDVETVRMLLSEHPELKEALKEPLFSFGAPALVYASARRDRALMEVLLDAGADIDARSDWPAGPFSALHHQIGGSTPSKVELAAFLIDRGATIDLHSAAGLGRTDVVADYLDAAPDRVNEPGPDGTTPLHLALDVQTAELLLERGAAMEQRCVDHNSTPAMWAIDERPAVLRFLLERGASADLFMAAVLNDPSLAERVLSEDPAAIRCRTREGRFGHPPEGGDIYVWKLNFVETPHEVARLRGNVAVYRALVDHSPPDIRLVQAAREGDTGRMRDILAGEPGLIPGMPVQLHWHLMCQAPEALEVALEFGANPNAPNRDGVTPLHQAAWQGELDKVRCLLNSGADPRIRDTHHASTPLGWATYNEQQAVADFLLENTELDLIDAIVAGKTDHAMTLLEGDPALADGVPGASPLRAAAYVGDERLVRRLLELGADVALENPATGLTALDMARQRGHEAVAGVLESWSDGA
jgi:ankyrin repeat protein